MAKTKCERRLEKVATAMERFTRPLPADWEEFVNTKVLPTYIFYNGKKKTGYCTTCKSDFSTKTMKLKHKSEAVCPVCGRKAIARSQGYSRARSEDWWAIYAYAEGEDVLTRYFHFSVDYIDYRNPKVGSDERFRGLHTPTTSQFYMFEYRAVKAFKQWDEYSDGAFFNQLFPRCSDFWIPDLCEIYNGEKFDEILANSPLRFAPFGEIEQLGGLKPMKTGVNGGVHSHTFNLDTIFEYATKLPLEKLLKTGLTNFASAVLRTYQGYWSYTMFGLRREQKQLLSHFDFGQKELVKLLKLNRVTFDLLKTHQPDKNSKDLSIWYFLQENADIKNEEDFAQRLYCHEHKLDFALKHSTVGKVVKYAKANNIPDWRDYIGWRKKLNLPLDEYYLFPKDLKEAHDRTYLEYLRVTDPKKYEEREKQNALIAAASKEKSKFAPFGLHYCGLFIKVAESADALRKEGEALHHCVGTYADKMASGKTTILFIRREDKPDEPFYTMEWNGKIIQLRGSHNCAPTKEVEDFRKAFEKAVDAEYKKSKKQAKAA